MLHGPRSAARLLLQPEGGRVLLRSAAVGTLQHNAHNCRNSRPRCGHELLLDRAAATTD